MRGLLLYLDWSRMVFLVNLQRFPPHLLPYFCLTVVTHKKNLCNIIILLNFMYVALFIHDSLLKLLNIRFKSFWESLEIWLNILLLFHAVILLDAQSEVIYLAILLWKYISYFPILYWFYKCGVPKGSCLILSNKRIMVTVSESNTKDTFLQHVSVVKAMFMYSF